jgi:hypothetical protein
MKITLNEARETAKCNGATHEIVGAFNVAFFKCVRHGVVQQIGQWGDNTYLPSNRRVSGVELEPLELSPIEEDVRPYTVLMSDGVIAFVHAVSAESAGRIVSESFAVRAVYDGIKPDLIWGDA